MPKGKIIFLNGVSSSGKTTLARALQEQLAEDFYAFGADTFAYMSPQKHFNHEPRSREIIGRAVAMMPRTLQMFSDAGLNVIADHVLGNPGAYEFIEPLHDYPVLLVHVTCPAEELRRREAARGDRRAGQAESQLATLYPHIYDLTVDTFEMTADECVDKINNLINNPENFSAFKILWEKRRNLCET